MSGFRKGTDIFLTRQIKKVCLAPSRWKTDLCPYVFVSRVSFLHEVAYEFLAASCEHVNHWNLHHGVASRLLTH